MSIVTVTPQGDGQSLVYNGVTSTGTTGWTLYHLEDGYGPNHTLDPNPLAVQLEQGGTVTITLPESDPWGYNPQDHIVPLPPGCTALPCLTTPPQFPQDPIAIIEQPVSDMIPVPEPSTFQSSLICLAIACTFVAKRAMR